MGDEATETEDARKTVLIDELENENDKEAPLDADSQMDECLPGIDRDRVHVQNIPRFFGPKHFKKFLQKTIGDLKVKKLRQIGDYAYVTFNTPEDAQVAVLQLHGSQVKGCTISAQLAETEVKVFRPPTKEMEQAPKTAVETVTPLAHESYAHQLEIKNQSSEKLLQKLLNQLQNNDSGNKQKYADLKNTLLPIIPAPKVEGYRNKCEFIIGENADQETIVGFVEGRFVHGRHYAMPVGGVTNISLQMKSIVNDVQDFVRASGKKSFDEAKREGFWRMLTVREFGGDVMIIFTVFRSRQAPDASQDEDEKEIQRQAVERFLNPSTFTEKGFRGVSLYWQHLEHASDAPAFQHIGGTPYIYESIMDCRFRVSPNSFFQTNSQAAAVLYRVIGECSGFMTSEGPEEEELQSKKVEPSDEADAVVDVGVPEKRARIEDPAVGVDTEMKTENGIHEIHPGGEDYGTIFLDICCGTGTIGQCILKEFRKNNKVFCFGVELIADAVEDAKQNAKCNGMADSDCSKYVAGKAEDVFRSLKYFIPQNKFDTRKSKVVGVLDPPRAGIHEKVIHACRQLDSMRRLVYVSCDPNAAMRNIADLCRPTSRKFAGDAFSVTKVQPVDMFPQTNHFEWVIQLDR